jgi:hypothetical protein
MSDNRVPITILGCLSLYMSAKILYQAMHRAYLAEEINVTGTQIPWATDVGNTIMGTMGLLGVIVSVRHLRD